MKRSAPLTRTVFKSRALGPTIGLCRDQRLEERAARALASATPRASVMACATAYSAPIAKECAATSKAYRHACAITARQQGAGRTEVKKLHVSLVFVPPTRRAYDLDNLLARMKSGLDGLADVLGVDDRHWKLEIDRSDEIGGFVRVEVTA